VRDSAESEALNFLMEDITLGVDERGNSEHCDAQRSFRREWDAGRLGRRRRCRRRRSVGEFQIKQFEFQPRNGHMTQITFWAITHRLRTPHYGDGQHLPNLVSGLSASEMPTSNTASYSPNVISCCRQNL
jgi:hypothetical protein